ncbi:MAG: class I SAM-dependent methyltransferase [Candidatus Daviesbacteria bacterium]|nr:class I SAM-dependent methyltransferase [Candidatus Daviesbacteria bacterium]
MKIKNQEAEYYEKFWKEDLGKENIFHGLPDWRENLKKRVEFYGKAINGRVLDAGCGQGDFALHIATMANVRQVDGIDLSQTAIKKCIQRAKENRLSNKAKFKTGSIINLPFKDKTFDSIFAFEIVEHIVDTEKMFQELNRILKMGGFLGITTVDFNLLKRIVISLLYFETYFDPTTPHIRFFTKNTLRKILEKNGFKLIQYKWDGSYFKIMPMGQAIIAQKYKDI